MRTPRSHRLTRRQSEDILDGRGGPADLSRLLADARPRGASGELPGEAGAVAAFHSAAVDDLAPRPRSSPVRTLSLNRSLAVKVLAIAVAGVAVGGAAAAATGHLPGSGHASTPAAAVSGSTQPTARPSVVEDARGPADTTSGIDAATGASRTPTGSPTGSPPRRDDVHAIGLCRAWAQTTRNGAASVGSSTRFKELSDRAGGEPKVAAYCEGLTNVWCRGHGWPTVTTVQVDGRPIIMRCLRPGLRPSGPPSHLPTPSDPRITVQPIHPVLPGGGKPAPLPTVGPVRD